MITTRKYSPLTPIAGLAVAAGSVLGASMVESSLGAQRNTEIRECIMFDADDSIPGGYSDSGYNSCIQTAKESNDIETLANFIQFAGTIGMIGFGLAGIGIVLNESTTEITTRQDCTPHTYPPQDELPPEPIQD